jgi:hypothetical protein
VPSQVVTGGPYANTPNGTFVKEVVTSTICAHQEYWFTIYDSLIDNPTVGDGMKFFSGNKNQKVSLLLSFLFSSSSTSFLILLYFVLNYQFFNIDFICLSGLREAAAVWQ